MEPSSPLASRVAVIGLPIDENSSFLQGAAAAPARIREAFNSDATNRCCENGLDLDANESWEDLGDLDLSESRDAFVTIEARVSELLSQDTRTVALGGDHSLTYPILRAYAKHYSGLTVLQLDAHPDLYDEFEGSRRSHACPFARIMEEELASRLVQIGIRTMNPQQREQAERFGVEVLGPGHVSLIETLELRPPLYLSVDLDVLDPAFAPGVSHREPGGLSTRQVIELIQEIRGRIVGADIVELNPEVDAGGLTATVAAKLLKETLASILHE